MSEEDSANLKMQRQLKQAESEIEQISRTLSQTLDDDPNMPLLLARLGEWHGKRFDLRGELEDIAKAIESMSTALRMTPDSDPSLPGLLDMLRIFHGNRYMRLNSQEDSDKELEYASRAILLTPDGHSELSLRLGNLGKALINRHQQLGDLGDLKRAIEHTSRAVSLISSEHPHFSRLLHALGVCHSDRFLRLGDLEDIEKAIEVQSQAVALTPNDHPNLPDRLGSLATSHKYRLNRLGELVDLDKAIECDSRALTLTPDGHPDLPSRLGNLGASHFKRYEHLGKPGDLDKAIEHQSRAVALIPEDHPDFPKQLGNLAASHSNRSRLLEKLDDLEKAIEYETRLLDLTPDDHPDKPDWFYNLGVSHAYRFELLVMQHDLQKVIEYMSSALRLTPEGHPSLPDKHFSLAGYRFLKYHLAGDPSDLQHSLGSFRIASSTGSPRNKFKYASLWAGLASENSSLNSIEAYQATINLLPQFIWLGATTDQRYRDLEQVQNVAICAAAAAIIASNYKLALEWLEHGRCVVWNQNLMLRSPLDQLHASHPTLATRLQTVANQLHHAGSESREVQARSSGPVTPEQVAQQHRRLAKEYDELISQARTLPGFEDFLQPIIASDLVKAARNGPIVVINCHKDCCDALVVMPGRDTIDHIPLPKFTGETAQHTRSEMEKSVRNSRLRERGDNRRPVLEEIFNLETVLAVLWDDVVKPILDFLGYTINDSKDNLPHITWCPTGALSFLPLHAAGDYNRPRSRAFDYVISSYTPTLTALRTSSSSAMSCNTRVLAIGQPKTPGHSPLPGTVTELAYLKSHTLAKVEYTQLLDDQATVVGVLNAMEQHDWVHLACHAHQNVQDPTKSGFFLHDDTLDLASINRRLFKGKGLAYLSACQTATGDEKLPDEAVHLASGLLMAGYSSVIATMWSVVDDDAPFVADKVYGQLMKDGKLGNGETGRALHSAVAELRERVGEEKFERWVPYIHIGS
ncbi:unnamed protein product [Rhizoctonia solani]|uniref:CHAT domain-containing protein n=1 Tax=Rhizoctonia solani TaxID=456999 RepID=A0A8H3HBX2_9AGAM|nr:unnamed protein product [Rhizoctonia solani]